MNATNNDMHDDDEIPAEIDFSKGVRGKYFHANAKLNLPVYLDQEVQAYLSAIASKKGVQLSAVANDLLKREIGIIEAVK